jgi:CRISPR/Cas system-associated protein Cas10 (large subunit of type III CRISPR-Cas system)
MSRKEFYHSDLEFPNSKRARVTSDHTRQKEISDKHAMELLESELAEKLSLVHNLILAKPSRNQRRRIAKDLQIAKQEREKESEQFEDNECVICLEKIDSTEVYCINASCGHIVYCTSCAKDSLECPKMYNKCLWCYLKTPHGSHCISF